MRRVSEKRVTPFATVATEHISNRETDFTVSPTNAADDSKQCDSSFAQVAKAAERELGAFLFAVEQMFGIEEVQRAADLWIKGIERADTITTDTEKSLRQITIQAAYQLARDAAAFRSLVRCALRGPSIPKAQTSAVLRS
ncbi:MAG TPA: hypothetical protein VHZ07_12435 [Bryobacteraceae bacterium]|jgi:hypothetical protein|nr:hypothetical protein [Bryobacteraceae bacterium]